LKTKYKKHSIGVALVAIITAISLSSATTASAQLIDITINDGSPSANYGSDPRPGIGESGETEAGTISNASWDMRAIAWDITTNKLTIVSGFNPLTTNDGFAIGDIFVDTNNSFTVPSRPNPANGYFTYANSLAGFEFAVDITGNSGGNLMYNIVALSGASTLVTGFYGQNAISDPASLLASPADTILASGGMSAVTTKTDAEVFTDLGINIGTNGGTNYIFSFDLTPIVGSFVDNGATFRLTQECGNDLLVGKLAPDTAIPEPSTFLLVAAAGTVCLTFRRRSKV
jgi:hypothetical protein